MSIKRKVKNLLRPFLRPLILKIRERGHEEQKDQFFNEMRDVINSKKYDAIVVFDVYFGFEVKMFQRPQHIALNLAEENILYFYKASPYVDKDIQVLKKIKDNLYLVNTDLYWLQEGLLDMIKESGIPAYGQIYSTCFIEYDKYLKKFTDRGFKIIYEYVDDLSDEIAGFKISKEVKDSHERMLKDTEKVYVATTADKLFKEAKSFRGDNKLALITNGVQYEHFANIDCEVIPEDLKEVIKSGKRIIGYFGALASWFDYDLIKKIAKELPDHVIVLIGIDYDKSLGKSGILDFKNVYYLGTMDYVKLPTYAKFFNVATIPFVVNEITEATSPVKLFEYMALGKPIVTTNLPECKKYESPLVSESHEEFINNIRKSIELEKDNDYIELLRKEGNDNTWKQKAKDMKSLILNS
ncbi:glycosyltransferase [Clostridium tarantellae]|uniref:Glycosyltransferase n=1 Tax=Clostridium tarantellae TaxID=39493 RepID=A0A6I1MLF1_9CLOT|nr:glycosyltransferase [Clostridium tarantellae]MPQ43248.1 glycosyltransferase [Clostridium tarantellae]